jgi:hypothetical protein
MFYRAVFELGSLMRGNVILTLCLREQDKEPRLARLQLISDWMKRRDLSSETQDVLVQLIEVSWSNREQVEKYTEGVRLSDDERNRI